MAHLDRFPTNGFPYLRYCGVCERPTVVSRLRSWFICLLFTSFLPLQLVYVAQNRATNLMDMCDGIMLMQVCVTALVKYAVFLMEPEKMYALVEAFHAIQDRSGEAEHSRFAKCHALHRKLGRVYFITMAIVGALYALNAIYATVTASMQAGAPRFVTPMNFPYNYQHPAVFALSFAYNLETIISTVCVSMTVDTCFPELANYLAVHFDIVGRRFAALDFSSPAGSTAAVTTERALIELIAYHGELLELAGKMMGRFQRVLFLLLLLLSTILCVLGYEFVVLTVVSKRLQVVAMAAVFAFQAVIYTYSGSMITEKSEMVSSAIYASNWYEASPAVKKMIYFCLMRAQRPVVMKGGFIEATLPTLKKILSSSGSYITLLLSFESDV